MARIKAKVVTAQELPSAPPKAVPTVNLNHPMKSASESSSTITLSPTCRHCKSTFSEMSSQDFLGHVASCTRPSTADVNDDTSDSPLSSVPDSPSLQSKYAQPIEEAQSVVAPTTSSPPVNGVVAKESEVSATIESDDEPEISLRPIPAYDTTRSDFYDKLGDREQSVATRQNSEEGENQKSSQTGNASSDEKPTPVRHAFQKFNAIEDFEEYVANAEEATYEDLYDRTVHITEVLVDYQKEWDDIEKEINAHETSLKAEQKRVAEAAKIAEEERTRDEDQVYLEIADAYKIQLKSSRSDWDRFLETYDTNIPKQAALVERLRSLRIPTFLGAINKRQKAREPEPIKMIDKPWAPERITKEELAADKRKRGRLIDQITFEDMKQADVYGFNYSAQPHHVGNQPQPTLSGKIAARGDASDEGRSRSQRNKQQKSYDADKSPTPEDENEELPAKRARKPRMNLDVGLEPQGRSRTGPGSRSGTPQPRTFPSGKRVGRPPSKLKDVQVPPPSATPSYENGSSPRMLAPRDEDALHDAAESLVNHQNQMGRMDFQSIGDGNSFSPAIADPSRPSTSSSTESSRKRKRGGEMSDILPSMMYSSMIPPTQNGNYIGPYQGPYSKAPILPPPPVPTPRPKRKRTKANQPEVDTSKLTPEELEKHNKKLAKSAKLSESLKARWEKGLMTGAMESRKQTNAKKKAAKQEAKAAVAEGRSVSVASAIVPPAIAPNLSALGIPAQSQSIIPPPSATSAPKPKRKYEFKNKASAAPPAVQAPESPLPIPAPATKRPATAKPTSAKPSPAKKRRGPPPPVATRNPSGRARRPTLAALGMDGIDDVDDEVEDDDEDDEDDEDDGDDDDDDDVDERHFKSEYEHFQALTSPGSPVVLGKRKRKSIVNLAAVISDDGEGDEGEEVDDYSASENYGGWESNY